MLNGDKRELAYIVRVSETKELDGYDKVHLCSVLGWQCIAPKDIKVGDLVVYFEIDSKLSAEDPRFAFMAKRKFVVKTIKMCGTLSQGLILPLSEFPELKNCKEGDFVTDKLNVEKHEPNKQPVKSAVSDTQKMINSHKKLFRNPIVKFLMRFRLFAWFFKKILLDKKKDNNKWPEWLPKTGSERIQNLPMLLGSDETYITTEKVDGASTSFILDEKNKYMVASHNVIKDPEKDSDGGKYFKNNIWAESGTKYNMEEVLKSLKIVHGLNTVAIQGETYGDKVQKRSYSLKNNKHDFVVFHIWFDGKRLPIKDMIKICEDRNLPHVHVYDYDYKIPKSVEEIVEYVDSCKSAIDNGEIEGFVFYSQDGKRNFKCVSPNFLLKYH